MIDCSVSFNGAKGSMSAKLVQHYIKNVPFAISKSLNILSADIVKEQPAYMKKVFSAPTQWTLAGTGRIPSQNKTDLTTTVFLKDRRTGGGTPVARYTLADRLGSPRDFKPFEFVLRKQGKLAGAEYVVPAKKFRKGGRWSIPRGELKKMMEQMVRPGKGSVARARAAGHKWRYFEATINGTHGIWRAEVIKNKLNTRRYKRGTKLYGKLKAKNLAAGRSLELMGVVTKVPPKYKAIFQFSSHVVDKGRKDFSKIFKEQLHAAVNARVKRTIKAKGA